MSGHSSVSSLRSLPAFRMSFGWRLFLFAAVAAGILCFGLLYTEDQERAWLNLFLGSVLFLGFGLCGLFFTAIQHLTSAKWSVVIRRIMEAMAMTLPIAALFFIPIFFGDQHLYEWTHAKALAEDALLQFKTPFLNQEFFGIRLIVYFCIWILSAAWLLRNSFKQDRTGEAGLSSLNMKSAAIILVLFGLSVSLAGFDILMSVEPHWFSTIFGVYFFAGFFQAGLGIIFILTWLAYRSGALKDILTIGHFHDIARFIFGFSIFWAYIAFSQFLLIWYGNLPEETFFFRYRMNDGWQCVALAILLLRFFLPFLILMPFGAKRNFKVVLSVIVLILIGHWLDLYWVIIPSSRLVREVSSVSAHLSWQEFGVGLGFVAFFLLILSFIMERIKLVPLNDPRLEASLHYYHHG